MNAPQEIVFLKHHQVWQQRTINRKLLLIWRNLKDRPALW